MTGNDPKPATSPSETEADKHKRSPDEAGEDQVDEALEETFPASDPISP